MEFVKHIHHDFSGHLWNKGSFQSIEELDDLVLQFDAVIDSPGARLNGLCFWFNVRTCVLLDLIYYVILRILCIEYMFLSRCHIYCKFEPLIQDIRCFVYDVLI
ncbi:hypothetical protein QVD17_30355 [Tagetes erecta]|uniref:Uncharacterized protein n=1 Tax=Tagetes erecta TaxID=13708 RepID=A0AAD8K1R2_TARER|nr:hypothetical protein QVD17_30355 [Tagetes erecta]